MLVRDEKRQQLRRREMLETSLQDHTHDDESSKAWRTALSPVFVVCREGVDRQECLSSICAEVCLGFNTASAVGVEGSRDIVERHRQVQFRVAPPSVASLHLLSSDRFKACIWMGHP